MGLGSWFARTVGSAMEWVGEKTNNNWLEEKGTELKSKFKKVREKTAEDIGNLDEFIESSSSILDTKIINTTLANFTLELENKTDDLETNVLLEAMEYFDSLINELEKSKGDFEVDINLDRVKMIRDKIEKRISGGYKNHLAKRISLGDRECMDILKMKASEEKKRMMDEFGAKVIREAGEILKQEIEMSIAEQQHYIEEAFNDRIEEIVLLQQEKISKFKEMEDALEAGEEAIMEQKLGILHKLEVCDFTLNSLIKRGDN